MPTVDGSWLLGIGDPMPMGWLTVLGLRWNRIFELSGIAVVPAVARMVRTPFGSAEARAKTAPVRRRPARRLAQRPVQPLPLNTATPDRSSC